MDKKTSRGYLITFDGIDKSGKSTQIARLYRHMQKNGMDVQVEARKRTNIIAGLLLDILEGKTEPVPPQSLAHLFIAEAILRQEKDTFPALDAGKIILLDRYVYSGYAYNLAMGIGDRQWNDQLLSFVIPADISFYLDISPEVALKRKIDMSSDWAEHGFSSSDDKRQSFLQFQSQVRKIYLSFVQEGKMLLINADRDEETIHSEIKHKIMSLVTPD